MAKLTPISSSTKASRAVAPLKPASRQVITLQPQGTPGLTSMTSTRPGATSPLLNAPRPVLNLTPSAAVLPNNVATPILKQPAPTSMPGAINMPTRAASLVPTSNGPSSASFSPTQQGLPTLSLGPSGLAPNTGATDESGASAPEWSDEFGDSDSSGVTDDSTSSLLASLQGGAPPLPSLQSASAQGSSFEFPTDDSNTDAGDDSDFQAQVEALQASALNPTSDTMPSFPSTDDASGESDETSDTFDADALSSDLASQSGFSFPTDAEAQDQDTFDDQTVEADLAAEGGFSFPTASTVAPSSPEEREAGLQNLLSLLGQGNTIPSSNISPLLQQLTDAAQAQQSPSVPDVNEASIVSSLMSAGTGNADIDTSAPLSQLSTGQTVTQTGQGFVFPVDATTETAPTPSATPTSSALVHRMATTSFGDASTDPIASSGIVAEASGTQQATATTGSGRTWIALALLGLAGYGIYRYTKKKPSTT